VDSYVLEENETASVFRVPSAHISQPKGDTNQKEKFKFLLEWKPYTL
jgi:hypothetical protein